MEKSEECKTSERYLVVWIKENWQRAIIGAMNASENENGTLLVHVKHGDETSVDLIFKEWIFAEWYSIKEYELWNDTEKEEKKASGLFVIGQFCRWLAEGGHYIDPAQAESVVMELQKQYGINNGN